MNTMLTGSVKEDRRAELGVSLGVDVGNLDVCFGGFSPTVVGDLNITWLKAEEAEARLRKRRQAHEKAAQIEAARESELRTWTDASGNVFAYVLLDGQDVRIKKCTAQASSLQIPKEIEGRPVSELTDDSCAHQSLVEKVVVPDSVVSIGSCAFQSCYSLTHLELPAFISEFDASWIRQCQKLSYLKLPGALEVLTPRMFDYGSLEVLVVGPAARDVQPGTFIHSHLVRIEVDHENPFIATDGHGLYSRDGQIMAALATPLERYRVQDGCKALGKKAFSSFQELTQVELPCELEVVGEFAFAHTSVREFVAPTPLKAILEKAFYSCRELASVQLNDGLELIAANAFTDTAIRALNIPATVTAIGAQVAEGTGVVFSGDGATFTIDYDNDTLFADKEGGLYEVTAESVTFVRLLERQARSYDVLPGTVFIAPGAFENVETLERVTLPKGLKEIGEGAFQGCRHLTRVDIPQSVRIIGDNAFLDTALESVTLPSRLEYLGMRALVTHGAHHGKELPTLRSITLGERLERFRMEDGMLLERTDDGAERVVMYVGPNPVVRIPETVTEICAYAFNGSTSVKELYLSDRISVVGVRGLAVDAPLDHIHIDLVEPHEGHDAFDIYPPHTDRSEQQMMLALTVPSFVNVEAMFEHYDNSILNASSFDALSENGLSEYERAVRLIERLEDPVFMSPVSQELAQRTLHDGLADIAWEMGRHDDRESLRRLADLGILSGENIDDVIESVQKTQDASITGFLLELKRERFGKRSFDFSL